MQNATIAVILGDANLQITERRVQTAADLLRDGHADGLALIGTERETRFMGDALAKIGIDSFFKDGKSIDTTDNALRAKETLSHIELDRLLLVTSRFHMPRSLITFRTIFKNTDIVSVEVKDEDMPNFHRYFMEAFPLMLVIRLAKLIPAKWQELVEHPDSDALGKLKALVYKE